MHYGTFKVVQRLGRQKHHFFLNTINVFSVPGCTVRSMLGCCIFCALHNPVSHMMCHSWVKCGLLFNCKSRFCICSNEMLTTFMLSVLVKQIFFSTSFCIRKMLTVPSLCAHSGTTSSTNAGWKIHTVLAWWCHQGYQVCAFQLWPCCDHSWSLGMKPAWQSFSMSCVYCHCCHHDLEKAGLFN